MRIDAYTHFIPKRFFEEVLESGDHKDIGKRVRGIPCIHDLDLRLKLVDSFADYAQILSYSVPPIEVIAKPERVEALTRMLNDGLAEIARRYPDHFPGFVAQGALAAPDAGVAEAERAINELGALGVQIYTNVNGKPLDRPEFEPFFAAMHRLGKPIWIHPARAANHPDYLTEQRSLYEIWWTFGWSYETAVAMARLVFSRIIEKYPGLKIIVHHFGGIVPMLEGRIGPGWDQLGARTSDEDYVSLRNSLKKRPLDYFKNDFYADTAVFGSHAATLCGMAFYPLDHVVFASDCPFDPEKGPGYIRETIRILDALELSKAQRHKVYYKNLEKLVGRELVKSRAFA
jgi:predicted TIM-barrel fold metal-dependent hydrolase